ncbi:nucleobindin-2 isoform X3 [Calonectris borealis]|uniref:nucleobindin-2 isoform X3 n=1 Tax=Calonectris borealis TaxID=1323832 RepID=UPI003F4BEBB1
MKWLSVLPQQCILLMTFLLMALEAVPIDIDKTKVKGEGHVQGEKVENPDTGLYYDEYLRQVIDVLETDKHFREKLQTADIEEIKSGKLSRELDLVSHHVRTRLDELKRQEVARLRMLIKAKMDSVQDTGIDHQALLKQFEHLNHQNPDTFEPKDLDMLIKAATSDLENYDKTRHEEFKKYEMMKEHERREYLKTLDEEKRQREESKFEEMKKKHGDHPKVHHPVDINKDRLVTLEEFLRATEKKEFLEPDSWETLDQQQLFTEDELKEFESHISQQEDELRKKAEDLQKQKEELQRQHDQLQAQKQELQQVVKQMEQKKLQQGNPPAGPAGELKFQPPGEHKVGDAPKHPAGGDQPLPPGHVQEPAARTDQVHP